MKKFMSIVLLFGFAVLAFAATSDYKNETKIANKSAKSSGLTQIKSCRTNIVDCLSKLNDAQVGITNSLAEWKALSASATKTAGVDTTQAIKDLYQAVKQLTQATRDLLDAIKKIERDE